MGDSRFIDIRYLLSPIWDIPATLIFIAAFKSLSKPKDLKIQLEQKAKEDNRSVSNYIVKLIQNDISDSPPA